MDLGRVYTREFKMDGETFLATALSAKEAAAFDRATAKPLGLIADEKEVDQETLKEAHGKVVSIVEPHFPEKYRERVELLTFWQLVDVALYLRLGESVLNPPTLPETDEKKTGKRPSPKK